MAYILALDQGTTSSRALIIDEQGAVVSLAQKEFAQFFPQPGLIEHDAEEIWSSQYSVAVEAIAKAGITASQISAIGIANQRETTILWERKTGRPIHRAIVWQDRRTASLCSKLKSHESMVREKTGLRLDPYFSATKIQWLLDHVPGAREKAMRGELAFGTVESWLVWKLTHGKVHVTDVSNASRTLLLNLHTLQWDRELLDLFEIPSSLLPEVRANSEIYGSTGDHIFSSSIPICSMIGDQQASLFGQGCLSPGMAKATFGTGCFLLLNTGEHPVFSKCDLLTTVAWKIGDRVQYALEGSVFVAGAAVQWFQETLGLIRKSSEIDRLAASVPDTNGVYFVPAFTGLGAPDWDPNARGAIFGLSRGTSGAHIARAVLESIALSAADILEAMEQDAQKKIKDIRVDGGVASSDLLMQLLADLTGAQIERAKTHECTALGAAWLAGLAAGVWKTPPKLIFEHLFYPREKPDRERQKAYWRKAVERCKGWAE